MPHVTKVFSPNLKGGVRVTLHPLTLLSGPSGSGKSAVVNAIELWARGTLSDYQGRSTVALERRLARATTDGAPPDVEVTVEPTHAPPPKLVYQDTLACLTMGAAAGMSALCAEPEDAEHPRDTRVNDLDAMRRVLGDYWHATAQEADTEFLRWYAHERERACRAEEALAQETRRHDAARWTKRAETIERFVQSSALFVPPRLGHPVVDLGSKSKPQLVLGLKHPRKAPRWALSGAEWVVTVTALALARFDALRATSAEWGLILPEDRGMDAELLRDWMKSLNHSACQALILTHHSILPKDSWQIVQFKTL